jgi:predicted transcriptional regulator
MPFPFGNKTPLQKPAMPTVKLTTIGNEKLLRMMPQGFEFTVLSTIKKLEPACSAGEVAKDLNWDEAKVTHIMESLYQKGWVERAN